MVELSELSLGVKPLRFFDLRTRVRGREDRRTKDGWYLCRRRLFSFLVSPASRYISRSLGKRTWVLIGPPNGGCVHSRSHIFELLFIAPHPPLPIRRSIFKIGEMDLRKRVWKVDTRPLAQGVCLYIVYEYVHIGQLA